MTAPSSDKAVRKRILLVDDSALTIEMTTAALEAAGYTVLPARDLDELERHRQSGGADLVLMDVQMPEAFGDDVAMVLRAVRGVNVPILLLSSLDEQELAKRAADAEIDGYISKRAGLEALVTRVRDILGEDRHA